MAKRRKFNWIAVVTCAVFCLEEFMERFLFLSFEWFLCVFMLIPIVFLYVLVLSLWMSFCCTQFFWRFFLLMFFESWGVYGEAMLWVSRVTASYLHDVLSPWATSLEECCTSSVLKETLCGFYFIYSWLNIALFLMSLMRSAFLTLVYVQGRVLFGWHGGEGIVDKTLQCCLIVFCFICCIVFDFFSFCFAFVISFPFIRWVVHAVGMALVLKAQ